MLAALVAEAGEAGGEAPVVLSEELGGGDTAGGSTAAHPPRPPQQDHHATDTLSKFCRMFEVFGRKNRSRSDVRCMHSGLVSCELQG